jgi:hypothetical protein
MHGPEHGDVGEPPDDPESWTDEQWITWLEATDDPDDGGGAGKRGPRRWNNRRPASVLGAAMLGMYEVIYGHKDEIVIVADAGGDPPGDDLPEVHLDPERPEVIVRHPHVEPEPPA